MLSYYIIWQTTTREQILAVQQFRVNSAFKTHQSHSDHS